MVNFCFNSGELPITQPTLYEYTWDMEQKLWIAWGKLVPKYVHVPERKFNEILVPTVDTVRTTWLLSLMVRIKRPVVLVGETGTSKSATIGNFLRTLDQDSHVRYLTLSPPVTTFVVCTSRLLIFFGNLYCKQYRPRSLEHSDLLEH